MAERKDFISKEEFPSNSFKSKEQGEKKIVKKVEMKGKVKKTKQSLGKRVANTFFDDDTSSVGQYILWDVLIPAMKSTLSDIVSGGIEMLLYGGERERDNRSRRDRGRSYVSYSGYYDDKDDRRNRRARGKKARHEFDEVIFDSRADAENVLTKLIDLIEEYDEVSVSDFYDMVGMDSTYTDRAWGWTNLRGSYVERGRYGYYIKLPRTVVLDDVPWDK